MVALRAENVSIERVLWSERIYLVPRGDGRILAGATLEHAGFDKRVTAGGECPCQYPTWSPDATEIAFAAGAVGREQIAIVPAAGGAVRLITPDTMRAFTPGGGS